MLGKSKKRCSYCNVKSDLVFIETNLGRKGFCGPVCASQYEISIFQLDSETTQHNLEKITRPVKAISKEILQLENLIDELIELDYYTTITSKRRKKLTLKRIRKLCQKMKTQIDIISHNNTFKAEDEMETTVGEVIGQYHWTLHSLKKMINVDVGKTRKFINDIIIVLENEYPELKRNKK